MEKLKIAALIPARSGSKRIPDKNIKELGGIPLMAHSIVLARSIGLTCYVSTDSPLYADIARDWGALTVYRPEHLCTDSATDYDVIRHFCGEVKCDLVVYLRPTTPFRTTQTVKNAISLMSFPGGYDSLRSVEEVTESPFKWFKIKKGLLAPLTKVDLTDKPNQYFPLSFRPNGYVDIVRSRIVETGSLWGEGRYAYVTERVIELDDLDQWSYAEWVINQKGRKWETR